MIDDTDRETLLYDLPEAREVLKISRSMLYQLIGRGEIRIVKIGTRSLIQRAELERYVSALPKTSLPQAS